MTFATKIRQFAAAALLAIAPSAYATLPYADGDLILGFRASGGQGATTCYEVNIGQATNFIGVANSFTVPIPGSIVTDLDNIFGADWKTRDDVFWSVSGVQFVAAGAIANRTIFASKAEPSAGTQSTPWTRVTLSTQNPVALRVQALGTPGYSAGNIVGPPGQVESPNCPVGLIQDAGAPNSYCSHMPGGVNSSVGAAYAFFVNGAFGIENSFSAAGTAASVVDLYQLTPGSAGQPATFLGAFRLNDSGQLTFSPNPGDFSGPAEVKFDNTTYNVSEDGVHATLTIIRTGNKNTAFTVNFSTLDGAAVAGTDFTGQTNTPVAFAANDTSKTVDVAIVDRVGFQGNRSFSASIALASGTATVVAPSTAAVNILENDPPPTTISFQSAAHSVAEDAGVATLTISRTPTAGAVSVSFSTQNGTAIAGTNFTGHTNTLVNFGDGEGTKTVDVAITDNPAYTGDLTFTAVLSNPTNGATLGAQSTQTVTIQETDPNTAGVIAFSNAAYTFASKNALGQPNTIVLTLNRTGGTTGAVSADVSLAAGGNLDSLDFTFTSPTTVNFADGQDVAMVNVPLLPGASPLPGTINFTLGNATNGASIGGVHDTTVTVTAPDKIPPRILLTSPKPGKSGANFNVAGTVAELDVVSRVEVTLNGEFAGNATLGANVNGVTTFSLDNLAAENGLNTLLVQAFDVNGTASLVKRVTFTYVNTRPQFAGSYNGLASPTGAAPPANDLSNASGFVSVTVTSGGMFSGKVLIGGALLPFKGVFANNGDARFAPALGETVALVKKGKVPVQFGELALHIGTVSVNTASGMINVSRITGTIGATATVECDRAAFDGRTTLVDPAVLANKGKYTCVLPAKAQPVLTTTQFPQGDGIGVISVAKNGKVKFIGSLADGTPVVASSSMSAQYTAPLFAALYSKKGSIAGLVAVGPANLNVNADISGEDFLWLRPASSTAKQYPAGWPTGVLVDFFAASYNGAKQNPPVSVFPGLNGAGEATLQFADGKLNGTVTKDVTISTTNKVTNVPATDKSYKLTIVGPTGALLGNFTHNADNTKTAFKGIIYQKGAMKGGYGYFLSNVPKGGPSGESGSVSVVAKP